MGQCPQPPEIYWPLREKIDDDPIYNLPADLSLNFSRWFFGGRDEFKPRKPSNLKPFFDKYIQDRTNNRLELVGFKLLTQELDNVNQLNPISSFNIYEVSPEKKTSKSSSCNEIDAGLGDKIFSRSNSSPNKSTNRLKKQVCDINLNINNRKVIMDSRPLIRRLEKVKERSSRRTGEIVIGSTLPIIASDEECDSDLEIPEIDCDLYSHQLI